MPAARDTATQTLVEQNGVGVEFECQSKRLGLTEVEPRRNERGRNVARGERFQPRRQDRVIPKEFRANRGGNNDAVEEQRQYMFPGDRHQRGQGRRVADDKHESAGPDFSQGSQVFREFLASVVNWDTPTPEFADQLSLTEARYLSRLTQRGLLSGEEANGEVQSRAGRREAALERCWKRDLHPWRLARDTRILNLILVR